MLTKSLRLIVPLVLAILFFAALNHGIQRWVILPSFQQLEQKQANDELQRVIDAIQRELEHLNLFTTDWSAWDDTLTFVKDGNQEYIISNLTMSTLEENSGINIAYFYNTNKKLVWGKTHKKTLGGFIELPLFAQFIQLHQQTLLNHQRLDGAITSIIDSGKGPILITSKPIITSLNTGPIGGTLIMGRFLDETLLKQIASQTRVDFTAKLIPKSVKATQPFTHKTTALNDASLQINGVIKNFIQQPILHITADIPRNIMMQGKQVAGLASVSILISFALLLLTVFLGFHYYTLRIRASNTWIKQLVKQRTVELKAAKESAEELSREAASANESKSAFLANMSHEIRTPLNAIINLSYLSLQEELQTMTRDHIEKVNASAKSLLRIINDILDFSKVEAGKVLIEESDFSLDQILEQLSVLEPQSDCQLIFNISPDTPTNLHGDILRINQIFLNLLSNAIKFTKSGSIILSIHAKEIGDNKVTLLATIQDTGIGMKQEIADKMFDPFTQADTSTTRRFGGTGLGLVICKQLCLLMDGNLELQSTEGKGTRAIVELSLRLPSQDTLTPKHEQRSLLLGKNLNDLKPIENTLSAFGESIVSKTIANSELIKTVTRNKDYFDILLIDDSISTNEITQLFSEEPPLEMIIVLISTDKQLPDSLIHLPISLLSKPIYHVAFRKSISDNSAENDHLPNKKSLQYLSNRLFQKIGKQRILLVEDNMVNQQVVLHLLAKCGVEVAIANNGKEGIDKLEKHYQEGNAFDIILMDIQMPVMDGMEATKIIRSDDKWQDIPIIALSANAMKDDREEGISLGMNDYLTKPIEPEALLNALETWCQPNQEKPSSSGASAA